MSRTMSTATPSNLPFSSLDCFFNSPAESDDSFTDLIKSLPDRRPRTPERSTSPIVLASPDSSPNKEERKSVQVARSSTLNWARPLQFDRDSSEQTPFSCQARADSIVRIFGVSLQRTKRMNRQSPSFSTSTSESTPLPSPVSSSDEVPLTPSPIIQSSPHHAQSQTWSTRPIGKGLGVGMAEWDSSPMRDYFSSRYSSDSIPEDSIASTTPSTGSSTPSYSSPKFMSSSQSLTYFASPTNLAELDQLRQAAGEMETEAKRSLTNPTKRVVRRKAVPRLSVLSLNSPDPSQPPHIRPRQYTLAVSTPLIQSSPLPTSHSIPMFTPSPKPQSPFYKNNRATQSSYDLSTRHPAFLPRTTSKHALQHSVLSDSEHSIASGSDSSRSSSPYKFGLRNLSVMDLRAKNIDAGQPEGKRKGLGRFLRRRVT